jgi:hypothetical protein
VFFAAHSNPRGFGKSNQRRHFHARRMQFGDTADFGNLRYEEFCGAYSAQEPHFALSTKGGWPAIFSTMTETVASKNGVPIRFTDERWSHITEEHAELAGLKWDVLETIGEPERILAGGAGELLALKKQTDGKFLVVVYREGVDDGFVVTAFLMRREAALNRRKQLWP